MISDIGELQKKEWLREQYEICSRVILLPDEPQDDGSDSANNLRLRFHKRNLSVSNIGGRYFGGVDVSFPEDDKRPFVAVYVIVDASDDSFPVVYQDSEYFHSEIPYVPSFLAFREIDPLLRLVRKQRRLKPDLTPSAILVDGNGLLHPRGAGIACFLGVRTGIPTIGIGKTLFCEGGLTKEIVARGIDESLVAAAASMTGKLPSSGDSRVQVWTDQRPITGAVDSTDMDKAPRKALLQKIAPHCIGLAVPLQLPLLHNMQQAETIGATKIACALLGHGGRSRGHSKSGIGTISPIFVSVGHKVSMSQAVQVTAFLSRVRIPEPVRQADLIGRRMLRDAGKSIT